VLIAEIWRNLRPLRIMVVDVTTWMCLARRGELYTVKWSRIHKPDRFIQGPCCRVPLPDTPGADPAQAGIANDKDLGSTNRATDECHLPFTKCTFRNPRSPRYPRIVSARHHRHAIASGVCQLGTAFSA